MQINLQRDITLLTTVHLVKAMVFPVLMYGCESWTIKKTECQRIDAFELRCWRKLLRVPWTAKRSNQSILKEISPEYSLEGVILKWNSNTLASCCKELTQWKRPWCWEKIEGRRRRGQHRLRWLDGITNSMDNSVEFEQALGVGDGRGSLCAVIQGVTNSQAWLKRTDWNLENKKRLKDLENEFMTAGGKG